MSQHAWLVVVVLILALFLMPAWPYAAGWGLGWYPSGILGLLALVVLILLLTNRI